MILVTMQYVQGPTGVFGEMTTEDILGMGEYFKGFFRTAIPADPLKPNQVNFLPQALPLGVIFDSPVNFVVRTFGYEWRVKALDEQAVFVIKRQILYRLRQTWKINLDPDKGLICLDYMDPRGVHV